MLRNFPLKNQFLLQNQLQVRLDCGSGTPIIGKVNLDVTGLFLPHLILKQLMKDLEKVI